MLCRLVQIALADSQQNHDSAANLAHDAPIHAYARTPHSLNNSSHLFPVIFTGDA
jgi:hypothetical protein